ncbi:hypothetical protein V3C99_001382 [Haemonchus contortus]|uniref:PH domain-containing protein n=1 Tax=Haemonchus contortus TaxID=6289 RepID=A0A7I5E983_HAECO
MEEDNAHDIFKWFTSLADSKKIIIPVTFREETYNAEIILYGNMLSCASTDDAKVPLIFVIEGATVQRLEPEDSSFSCGVSFPDSNDVLILRFDSEKTRESWMIRIATCSHQMVRAQLDEMAYKFYTMGTKQDSNTDCSYSKTRQFYLTNPYRVTHTFAISQQNNLPSRRVAFEEIMSESKLSLILPLELVKLYKKWITEFSSLLEIRQHQWPAFAIPYLYDVLREIRANTETLEQCYEFLENYSGPSFRKSTEKHRVAFAPVPTNLHVHQSTIDNRVSREVLSCGTTSALPLRFQYGGLSRITASLEIDRMFHDLPFWSRRYFLFEIKKKIGQLNYRLDTEWDNGDFEKRAKLSSDLSSEIKSVFERFKQISEEIAELDRYAEILVNDENRRASLGQNVTREVPDTLQNQMDTVDAMVMSLTTKVAVMDKIKEEESKSEIYEKTVRDAICLCFDMLLALADSVLESQLFGLVVETHRNSTSHLYFHVQLRSDFILSQSITIAATAVLNTVYRGWPVADGCAKDLLLTVFSFLSAYGDERGMAEDAWEAWRQLEARVVFTLIRAPSEISRTCIPLVSGQRNRLNVSLPLPHEIYDALPAEMLAQKSIVVRTAFFNIGVNYEATLGQSFGGVILETGINHEGAEKVLSYSNRYTVDPSAREAAMELVNVVASEPSRKNLAIFEWAMLACELLEGHAVICCKSGKDRTGMAVTIEQGRVFRETCGLNAAQLQEVIASLRRDGARRENCRKNVGKGVYSFSPFQMHFLPKPFRPPSGTYAQGIAS